MDESANVLMSRTASSLISLTGPVVPKLTLSEFDAWVKSERTDTKRMDLHEATTYNIMCLASEAGEVADAHKMYLRGDYRVPGDAAATVAGSIGYMEDILLELGDVLHYVCRIADDHGWTLQDVADANVEKLTNRKYYGKGGHGKRS